jgi:23S rRNA (adenine2503-C2)-methyltransferase
LPTLTLHEKHRAHDGTLKLRIRSFGGQDIEAVIIPANRRVTVCVSSQVGCAAGCTFCHTGTMGLLRNLQTWEILEQLRIASNVWAEEQSLSATAKNASKITNIVFMGMGEPLHNSEAVINACRIFNSGLGAGFSYRHVVVSTAGVGELLRPLYDEKVASLSISLHATTDAVRDRLVPLNRLCNLENLRRILLAIPWRASESLTVAYLLLENINDTRDDARRLREWCEGLPAKVNLLEFNPYPESTFRRTSSEKLAQFRQWLYEEGLFNTHRHSRGDDVMAACGQLATPGKKPSAVRNIGRNGGVDRQDECEI